MEISSIQQVYKSGNASVIVIPQKVINILEIEEGDYLNITINEVVKTKKKTKTEEKEKKRKLPEL